MKKHPKTAFGILEDGKTIKLALLMRDVYQVYLMDLQRVDLDKSLYQAQEPITEFDVTPPSQTKAENGELQIGELEADYSSNFQINPWSKMFSNSQLEKGVIALNVNEDQIIRSTVVPSTKKEEKNLIRSHLTPQQYKAGEWQTSRVKIGSSSQFWLHSGINQLLEMVKFNAHQNKKRLYYQLADANDLALADYYRIYHLAEDQRVLLIYLGTNYRKAFLFDNGDLLDIFSLNITQEQPDPELIMSRVSLAMDNVQQTEPDLTVICGDLASETVVNAFIQNGSENTTLLTYPLLIVESSRSDQYDATIMAQHALPIALAYKALFPDEPRFTPSNFLPKSLIEAQKPLKFAWHGFLLLFILFTVVVLGTLSYLNVHADYTHAKQAKRRMDHEAAVLKLQTAELTKMRNDIVEFGRNLEAVRAVLVGKNPWSEVLDTLNRLFQSRPISWLTNLKKEGSRLMITGVTTNRSYVIDFAEALPNSRIQKVTNIKIHENSVWSFEISSDFPTVDWVGQIEAEMAAILEQSKAEEALLAEEPEPAPPSEQSAEEVAVTPPPVVSTGSFKQLPPIPSKNLPHATEWQSKAPDDQVADYNTFLDAINRNEPRKYTELASAYLEKYPEGRLVNLLRWHLAYRLYRDGDYTNAIEYLDPMVHKVDEFYPNSLLLAARIDYARHKQRAFQLYAMLELKYPKHPIQAQVAADIAIIGRGGEQ